jgi:hypothetical protein
VSSVYAIRDSILESIEQDAARVTLNLRAIRNDAPDGKSAAPNLLRQQIRLVFEGAQMEIDSSNLPTWLLEGSFRCDELGDGQPGVQVANAIPASLRSAAGVHLVLSGLLEDSGEYITIDLRSETLTLEPLRAPEPLLHTRASI